MLKFHKKQFIIVLLFSIIVTCGFLYAQETGTEEGINVQENENISVTVEDEIADNTEDGFFTSIIRFYKSGGPFMHAILFLGLIALAIAIERGIKLWLIQRFDLKKFYFKLRSYLHAGKYKEAMDICIAFKKTTMGSIFLYGIKGFIEATEKGKKGKELSTSLQNSFDEAALNELPKLEKRLHYLDTFAQMATLLGLLGTIFGLIVSFQGLGSLPPEQQNAALSAGIAIALHTTAFGLIIALPTMLVKAFLQSKANTIINQIDEYAVKTINTIEANINE